MQPLSDLTVCEGDIAQMEVRFSQENVEGTWKKNGQPLTASNRVHIIIDKQIHKLLIEDTIREDLGTYSFEVPAQGISTSAKLVVQSKGPQIHGVYPEDVVCFKNRSQTRCVSYFAAIGVLIPLKDTSSVEGTKTVLETKISAQDISSVKWFHNEQLLKPSDRIQMVTKGAKQRLVFNRTYASDEGHYKLVVGRTDTSCRLSVQSELTHHRTTKYFLHKEVHLNGTRKPRKFPVSLV